MMSPIHISTMRFANMVHPWVEAILGRGPWSAKGDDEIAEEFEGKVAEGYEPIDVDEEES